MTIKAQVPVEQLDAEYLDTQRQVQAIGFVLLNTIEDGALDRLIERAERSLTLSPILHPGEFHKGAERLSLLIRHARIIRDARHALKQTLPSPSPAPTHRGEHAC